MLYNFFGKGRFSEETAKHCSGGAFNNFLGRGGFSGKTDVLLSNKFFEKCSTFGKKCKKPFVGKDIVLRGGVLETKINTTFFGGIAVLNIFHLRIFSKKQYFPK